MRYYLLLCLLLAFFFWKVLFLGYDLTGMADLYNDSIFRSAKTADVRTPLLEDPSPFRQMFAWAVYASESFRKGRFPLWNPHNGCGAPLLANWQSTPFSPLKVIFYLFPSLRTFNIYLILYLLMAGWCTFLLAKKLGIGRDGAIFSSVTYMLGGSSLARVPYIDNTTASCFPLLLLGTEKLLSERSFLPYYSLIISLVIFSGHPETAVLTLFASLLYALARTKNSFRQIAFPLFMSYVLGLLLACVTLLPFSEYLLHAEAHRITIKPLFLFFQPLREMMSMFLPSLFSGEGYNVYLGIVGLGLGCYGACRPSRYPHLFVVLLAGIFLTFRPPPLNYLMGVPPLSLIDPLYAVPLYALPMSLIGGIVLDNQARNKFSKKILGAAGLSILGVVIFFVGGGVSVLKGLVNVAWLPIAVQSCLAILLAGAGFFSPATRTLFLVCVQIVDLFINGMTFLPLYRPFTFPETPALKFLKKEPGVFRVIGLYGSNLAPNTSLLYHLDDVRINDPIVVGRYMRLMKVAAAAKRFLIMTNTAKSPLWDLLNVRYVIQAKAPTSVFHNDYPDVRDQGMALLPPRFEYRPIQDSNLPRVYSDRYVNIYKNLRALPRAFVVHEVQFVRAAPEALDIMSRRTLDFKKTAVIEAENETRGPVFRLSVSESQSVSPATILMYEPHHIRIWTKLPSPGFLILSDTYYPGWKVYVDGKEDKILPADYLLRGVFLKEGEHEINFVYRPLSFVMGRQVSLGALFLIIFMAVWRSDATVAGHVRVRFRRSSKKKGPTG